MDNRRLIKKSLVYGIIGILICTSIVPLIEYVRADGPGYEIAPGTLINRVPERILARTSDGVMHCVYYRSDGSHSQIYHSFSSDYGVTWTEEPVTSGNYDQQYPAIAVDSQDALHVVWAGYHSGSPTVLQIRYCKRISSDWQTIENLTNEPYPQDETSAIAIDGNDAVHVVWSGIAGPDPAWPHVRYRKYTTSWGPINELQEAVGYSGLCAAIAIDNNNYVHVVWESGGYHHQSSYHLVYQRYTTYWEPYEPISITDNNPVGRACIAVESNGDVHLIGNTWEGIAHKEKTSAGWQNADLLESSYTLLSSISIDSHEYLHVVWQYNGNIKYRKYTTSWQPTETIISDTDSTAPYLLWSWYPVVNGVHPNRPQNGYAFVWNDGLIIRFYKSSDLKWEGGDQSDTTYWLAKGIMSEASIGVQQEQIAVGWCVLNRLHNESFGETMEAVVKNGFAWNQEPTQQIKNLANDLLEGIQPDPTDGALYFFSPRSMPKDGENTQGYDVEGRIHIIPGTSYKVYFPSWAEPTKEIDENTKSYQTTSDMEWTELNDIRNWYFMFYHPYSSQISSHVDEPNQRRNIMLTGFWNPTGQMIAQFSTDPSLNPGGWKGENWENLGYTIYSYFPTSGTYTGVFQVDYQATLEDFQNITDKIKPVAIISFGAGDKGYSWTIEHNARNLNIWEDDEKAPTQPTPCPPDSSQNVGYVRHSTLPVQAIENAVKTQTSVEAWVDWDGNPGAYLCEYMAYLGMQYQALHNTSNDPYQCLAAGFIHVKPDLKLEDAMMATNVTIREVVKYLQNTPSDHTGNKQPGFEIIIIIGAIALVLFWKRKRRDGD